MVYTIEEIKYSINRNYNDLLFVKLLLRYSSSVVGDFPSSSLRVVEFPINPCFW